MWVCLEWAGYLQLINPVPNGALGPYGPPPNTHFGEVMLYRLLKSSMPGSPHHCAKGALLSTFRNHKMTKGNTLQSSWTLQKHTNDHIKCTILDRAILSWYLYLDNTAFFRLGICFQCKTLFPSSKRFLLYAKANNGNVNNKKRKLPSPQRN